MKQLSAWAKKNPWKARLIIIISHILILLLAWFTGSQLFGWSDTLPTYLKIGFIIVFIIAAFFYPVNRDPSKARVLYVKQKTCDFLLALSTFGMVTGIAASGEISFGSLSPLYASTRSIESKGDPTAEEILASLKYRNKKSLTRQEKRILKTEFKKQLKIYAQAKITGNKAEGDNAGLLILAILGAVGLFYLVAALSCSLSCNGSDAAAVVVLILGTAAIVLGLLAVIRSLRRKKRRRIESQVN